MILQGIHPICGFGVRTSQSKYRSSVSEKPLFGIGGTKLHAQQEASLLENDSSIPIQKDDDCSSPSECKLIICQITDVYSLEHLASFKTLVEDVRNKNPDATVISMLTGDFLSPYLLSTVDNGNGMMNALGKMNLDYLTWGNHEADVDHDIVCNHVKNFPGKFINSNMLDHEVMEYQQEYDVIKLCSRDQKQQRKVGLCAVLSNDPDLYSHFPEPGAFGGAHITDPWEALTKYKKILENEEGCDVVIPLQHLYVPDDHRTCREFDFPLILSGHDHHRVDEVVEGTRLIKAGMNAVHAAVVEMSWKDETCTKPTVESRFVKCSDWTPDPELQEQNERAYDALLPLRNTQLATVPKQYFPLSSGNARGEVCSMGQYICTLIKAAMTFERPHDNVDAVLLMGGNIRGNVDKYPEGTFFSLETLKQETKEDEKLAVVPMPGWLLAEGIQHTHSGDPIPGWIQYDSGVQQDEHGRVTHVADAPLVPNRVYRVATKVSDLTNGQCPPWVQYYEHFPHVLPTSNDAYVNVQSELMSFFAKTAWLRLWQHMTEELLGEDEEQECTDGNCPLERFTMLDMEGKGFISIADIQHALRGFLKYSIDDRETSLAELIHAHADHDEDGLVTMADVEHYCSEMATSLDGEWALSYDRAVKAIEAMEAELADFLNGAIQSLSPTDESSVQVTKKK